MPKKYNNKLINRDLACADYPHRALVVRDFPALGCGCKKFSRVWHGVPCFPAQGTVARFSPSSDWFILLLTFVLTG